MDAFITYGLPFIGLAMAAGGFFWRKFALKNLPDNANRKDKINVYVSTAMMLAGAWFFIGEILSLLFGEPDHGEITVEIWAPRTTLFGMDLSTTVLVSWWIVGGIGVLALLFRLLMVPKMTDEPGKFQNAMEMAVEGVCNFTHTSVGDLGDNLPAYLFSTFVFLLASAAVELMGVRAPTADITMTFALSLVTFILINYFGLKKKGLIGRVKSMANPSPAILPIKIVSDLAVPISLACRLFGNMLAGMIVMELLYAVLGSGAVGIPSVAGVYFNIAHPIIQAYIFVTLTLTFIGEATEEAHE
ncbi:MAG: FoF1 ATP synthase subunit a [Eubacteriales bacterium]